MPTAILIDGGYFVKRFRRIEPHNAQNAQRAAELAFRWAILHLSQMGKRKELYRIFFYDCAPLQKRMHNPVSGRSVNFAMSDEAVFRTELHRLLKTKRKVALRLGELSQHVSWTIPGSMLQDLLKKRISIDDITAEHVVPDVRQKGVDMRIAIDISSLSLKKQVDQIVLFAGDADFVPAAKLARREGIDFVLDPMWNDRLNPGLNEHVDGIRSVSPRPATNGAQKNDAAEDPPMAVDVVLEAEVVQVVEAIEAQAVSASKPNEP